MRPRSETNGCEHEATDLGARASAESGRREASGTEPGAPRAGLDPARAPEPDLWLGALDALDREWMDPNFDGCDDEAAPCAEACREAEELLTALADVATSKRRHGQVERAPHVASSSPHGPTGWRSFDARILAERLLAESRWEPLRETDPAELLAAQLGLGAIGEELLARLLEGLVAGPHGSDEASPERPLERGLLLLLALELHAHEARGRNVPPVTRGPRAPEEKPPRHADGRLLEVLAVPHAASRPVAEKRPRGRPRR